MKDEARDAVAAYFRNEIGAVGTPPFPGIDSLRDRAAVRTSPAAKRREGRRSMRPDLIGMAVAACLLVLCMPGSDRRSAAVPARGAESLVRDRSIRENVSTVLFVVALRLGESICKE